MRKVANLALNPSSHTSTYLRQPCSLVHLHWLTISSYRVLKRPLLKGQDLTKLVYFYSLIKYILRYILHFKNINPECAAVKNTRLTSSLLLLTWFMLRCQQFSPPCFCTISANGSQVKKVNSISIIMKIILNLWIHWKYLREWLKGSLGTCRSWGTKFWELLIYTVTGSYPTNTTD